MTAIDDKFRNEKLQYNINIESSKILEKKSLSSRKIDKYEYLTGEEILLPDRRRVIEETKLANSPLRKAFEKQAKRIEEPGKNKQMLLEFHQQR